MHLLFCLHTSPAPPASVRLRGGVGGLCRCLAEGLKHCTRWGCRGVSEGSQGERGHLGGARGLKGRRCVTHRRGLRLGTPSAAASAAPAGCKGAERSHQRAVLRPRPRPRAPRRPARHAPDQEGDAHRQLGARPGSAGLRHGASFELPARASPARHAAPPPCARWRPGGGSEGS